MKEAEAAAAWKLAIVNWLMLAGMFGIFALSVQLTDFEIKPKGFLIMFAVAAVYGIVACRNLRSPARQNPRIVFVLNGFAQTLLVVIIMTPITYMATAANLPLRDTMLLAADRTLGLDFRSYLDFVHEREWLIYLLAAGYRAISWPILLIAVVLPLAGHYRRVGEYIFAFGLALMLATLISTLVPAIGVYGALGLVASDYPNLVPQGYYDTLHIAPLLRDGSLRMLDLFQLGGVLTFPSFHAASAVLYAWALWPIRWARPLNLAVNGLMIAATPVGGGHYFADVIAGIGVAALAIWAACRVGERLARLGEATRPAAGGLPVAQAAAAPR